MNHVVCHFVDLYVPSPSLDIVTMQNEEISTSETRFCYPTALAKCRLGPSSTSTST